ncbi:hypothetical protein D9M69_457140 [compost metagenome]
MRSQSIRWRSFFAGIGLEPTTNSASSFGASSTEWSGSTRMPLLACTGSRSRAISRVRYSGRCAARLAMRRVSTAEAKPMVVKLGISRKP